MTLQVENGEVTCTRPFHGSTGIVTTADPDREGYAVATCEICNRRAAQLRGVIIDAMDAGPLGVQP